MQRNIEKDLINHIIFIGTNNNLKYDTFNLVNTSYGPNIFKIMKNDFTISTKNGSYMFNKEILRDTSSVISKFLEENPQNLHYHLDINDERKVLKKFKKLYHGKSILFDIDDLPISQQITDSLDLKYFPNFLKSKSLKFSETQINVLSPIKYEPEIYDNVSIYNLSFKYFLQNRVQRTFSIITNKKEYKCNIYGVQSSSVISKALESNQYLYDYDDEFGEFQLICDLFNFLDISITEDNCFSLEQIAIELQIKPLINEIEKINKKQEKISQIFNEDFFNSYENLFQLLYHIKENKIETIKDFIIKSNWGETKEKVQELAAIILQVVNNGIQLHQLIVELLIQLDQYEDHKQYKLLIPFLIKKLMKSLEKSSVNCSFIYNLYKTGFVTKNELKEKLFNVFKFNHLNLKWQFENNGRLDNSLFESHKNILFWFLPELIEFDLYNPCFDNLKVKYPKNLCSFLPDKIDLYKKMRDDGEPDDIITKLLRNDNVDELQNIITLNNIDILQSCVHFNIFEDFVQNGETNFLNYSAAYGSIKCFKYLLLNHAPIDELTLEYAIFGENVEIIKIAEQNSNSLKNNDDLIKVISISIKKHKDDLFDWLFEQKIYNNDDDLKDDSLTKICELAAINGNVHVLAAILNRGLFSGLLTILRELAKNGFYQILIRIYDVFKKIGKNINNSDWTNIIFFATFGNLSICKFAFEMGINTCFINEAIKFAVEYENINIVEYLIDYIDKEHEVIFDNDLYIIFNTLDNSINSNSSLMFNFIIKKFKHQCQEILTKPVYSLKLLKKACEYKNIDVFNFIFNSFKNNYIIEEHTNLFYIAALSECFEICQILIDFHPVDIELLSFYYFELSTLNDNIFNMIFNNCKIYEKQLLLSIFLYPAIYNHNINLVEFLLKENAPYNDSLFIAVDVHDHEIVNLILRYHKESSFINKRKSGNTALSNAVKNNDISIVKQLLSIPDINLSLSEYNDNNPLVIAIQNLNIEICKLILNFSCDNDDFQLKKYNFLKNHLLNFINLNNKENDLRMFIINDLILTDIGIKYNFYPELKNAWDKKDIKLIESLLKIDIIEPNNIDYSNDINDVCRTFYYSKGSDSKLLLSNESLDVNYTIYKSNEFSNKAPQKVISKYTFLTDEKPFETALMIAVELNDIEKIDAILSHPSFSKEKSCIKISIYTAFRIKNYEILNKLFKKIDSDDINNYIFDNNDLLNLAVIDNNIDTINLILNNCFSLKVDYFYKAIINILSKINEKSFDILNIIFKYYTEHDYNIKFNQLLPNGLSFFTSIKNTKNFDDMKNFEDIINLLLKYGADPNIKDNNNIYPLQYAIKCNSIKFVLALINSNKINLSQRDFKEKKSYIHLAACSSNPKILIEFLNRKLFDINSVDSLNQTPLFYACLYNKKMNVIALFENDDLDYYHKDKSGHDVLALSTATHTPNDLSKNDYLEKLLSVLIDD